MIDDWTESFFQFFYNYRLLNMMMNYHFPPKVIIYAWMMELCMVGIWLCHIPVLHHHDIFTPGGNMTSGNVLANHDDDDDDDDELKEERWLGSQWQWIIDESIDWVVSAMQSYSTLHCVITMSTYYVVYAVAHCFSTPWYTTLHSTLSNLCAILCWNG